MLGGLACVETSEIITFAADKASVCFPELYVLLGIRGMDGLLHQPPAIHAT